MIFDILLNIILLRQNIERVKDLCIPTPYESQESVI